MTNPAPPGQPAPPAQPRKPSYRTFAVEQHVDAPRSVVWDQLVALLAAGDVGPVRSRGVAAGSEEVLSFEPPWRRVARMHVDGLAFAEHTIALRDDVDSCHLVWAFVIEPPPADAPPPVADSFEAALEQVMAALRASVRIVAETVEAS